MNYGLITTIMQNPQFVSPAGRLELGNIGSNPTEKIWFANLTNGCVSRREEGQEACDWISDKREKLLNFESKSKKVESDWHLSISGSNGIEGETCVSPIPFTPSFEIRVAFHFSVGDFLKWDFEEHEKKSSYRVFRGCYLRLCPQSNVMRFLFYQIGRGEK